MRWRSDEDLHRWRRDLCVWCFLIAGVCWKLINLLSSSPPTLLSDALYGKILWLISNCWTIQSVKEAVSCASLSGALQAPTARSRICVTILSSNPFLEVEGVGNTTQHLYQVSNLRSRNWGNHKVIWMLPGQVSIASLSSMLRRCHGDVIANWFKRCDAMFRLLFLLIVEADPVIHVHRQ